MTIRSILLALSLATLAGCASFTGSEREPAPLSVPGGGSGSGGSAEDGTVAIPDDPSTLESASGPAAPPPAPPPSAAPAGSGSSSGTPSGGASCGWPEGTNCRANYGSGVAGACCATRPTCGSRQGADLAGPQPWNYTTPYMSFCF
jgi:hypothetical protein